jgi:hypothetical protein
MATVVTILPTNNNILDTQEAALVPTNDLVRNFGSPEDYVEMHVFDPTKKHLYSVSPFKGYKVPGTFQPSVANTINELTFSPDVDLKNLGISFGDYTVIYNILRPKVNLTVDRVFFIKEISANRQEIRLSTNNITNSQLETGTLSFINEIQNLPYFKEFYINFGENNLLPAINIALDQTVSPSTILIKLLDPLPTTYTINTLVSIVDFISNPQAFEVNIEPDSIPITFPTLRGPNFGLELDNVRVGSSPYYNFDNIFNSFTTSVDTELQTLLGNLSASNFSINVDYTDYSNFTHFSSANRRLNNFKYKLSQIELFTSASASAASSGILSGQIDATNYQTKIGNIIQGFDGYDKYLYFESSSYSWPKYNSTKPYINQSVTASQAVTWFNNQSVTASLYDDNNSDYLLYALPGYINENTDNEQLFKFVATVGQMFDDIWVHIKAITDLYQAKNKLTEGISKDLVYFALRSLGINLYTDQDQNDVFNYLFGSNTNGSYLPLTSSYQTLISGSQYSTPGKDQIESIYKRIYANLPLLLKSKGTTRFVQYLNTIYGIPSTIMSPIEYGGADKVSSSFEYEYDRFSYALCSSGSNTISIPWNYLSQSAARTGYNDIVADSIEFRFKASPLYAATQSLFYSGSNFKLDLLYTNTASISSPYAGTTGDFGYFKFTLGNSSVTLPTIPVFTTGSYNNTSWYSVLIQRSVPNLRIGQTSTSQTYNIYVKNNIWGEIGHVVSASLTTATPTTNSLWYTQGAINFGGGIYPFSGSYQEIRLWSNAISESAFNFHVLNPQSIEGNNTGSAFSDLTARFTLGNNLYTYNHALTSSVKSTHPDQYTQVLNASFSNFPNKNNYVPNVETYYANAANSGYSNPVVDKVRIIDSNTYGTQLLPNASIEVQPILPITKDIHLLDSALSPMDEIDKDIIAQLGSLYSIDDIIGDPRDTSYSYDQLDTLRTNYFKKYQSKYNYKDFITLIEYFHNSLFKTLKDFIPAKTNVETGIVIRPHLLERSKDIIHSPSIERENNVSASIVIVAASASNGGNYYSGYSDGSDFFKGELTGSTVDVHDMWVVNNYNPYLNFDIHNTDPVSQSLWNVGFNSLLNNVSGGIVSNVLHKIEYQNATHSVTSSIDFQDFTYDYKRHARPRYDGSQTVSYEYNFFLPQDATLGLNKPYGKNSVIDTNTSKFAFFSEATCTGSQTLGSPERTNLYLKYLIDESGSLTELTRRDYATVNELQRYNLYEIQNIFKTGDSVNIALFDNQNPSRQKPLDGNHSIFVGGFRFYPMLWRISDSSELYYYLNQNVYPAGLSTGASTNKFNFTVNVSYRQIAGYSGLETNRNIDVTYHPPVPGDYLAFDVIVTVRISIFAGSDDVFQVLIPRANPDGTANYTGHLGNYASGWRYNSNDGTIDSVVPASNYSSYQFEFADPTPYLTVDSVDTSIISCSAAMSEYYAFPSLDGGFFFSGSNSGVSDYTNNFLLPEYPFQLNPGDLVRFSTQTVYNNNGGFVPQEEYTIIDVSNTNTPVTFQLDRKINNAVTGSTPHKIQLFVFSKKVPDETNVIVSVKKQPGQTSGGIVKNINLVKRVDDNIANLVSDLKSKIFSTVLTQ